jgi:hypothetical protein
MFNEIREVNQGTVRSKDSEGKYGLACLKEENEFQKKRGLLCKKQEVRYQVIRENKSRFQVSKMCLAMNVSRSCYYAFLNRP